MYCPALEGGGSGARDGHAGEQFRRGVVSLHGARGSPIEEYRAELSPVYYHN
jgi:hypothetical protein